MYIQTKVQHNDSGVAVTLALKNMALALTLRVEIRGLVNIHCRHFATAENLVYLHLRDVCSKKEKNPVWGNSFTVNKSIIPSRRRNIL